MTNRSLTAKVGPEGRVVIPAIVRRQLNIRPGDLVRFEVHEDRVELISAGHLVDLMWANNPATNAGDSATTVRQERVDDQLAEIAAEERGRLDRDEPFDEAARTASLLSALGLE